MILNKNKTYFYSINTFAYHGISEGKWKLVDNLLTLESTYKRNNIPVEISYENESSSIDSFDIAVVRNIKHELLTSAFVLVNNDSLKCLPSIGRCNGSLGIINRVKVLFENGISSKWIVVEEKKARLQLTVLTDISIENYIIMNKQKFELNGKFLKEKK
ncbi:hypothetical protein ECE50_000735 [Chitinophaga sp. Mgbs1]|uniref:Uncharacterized protein n=1 Tax=Chitinophaga solisilvae TaxID=1233460 RepID=A0A9Q5CVW6_9BACT|nr:hypothetical protein [Chitinophaga solisilvae]